MFPERTGHIIANFPAAQRARIAVAYTIPIQPIKTTPALRRARHHLRNCIAAILDRYDDAAAQPETFFQPEQGPRGGGLVRLKKRHSS